jgi:hypothetical protein
MIFFNVPSVGQLKPETLFGDDDHYGFIQTLIGEKYVRAIISDKCSNYYETNNTGYWDRLITIINFLGLKKLDNDNTFCNIPLLDYVGEKFDEGDFMPSQILFDYLLCQWQYPHPIVTRTANLEALDITLVNPRLNVPIFKPYILIIAVLKELYKISPEIAYFTKEEFYWFGYQAYQSSGLSMRLDNTVFLAEQILGIRKNGWSKFADIKEISSTATHLSYPLGFIRNSSILTDEKNDYNIGSDFFIGLKKLTDISEHLDSIINSSSASFEFDRNKNPHDKDLCFSYSNYLYNQESINAWIENVTFYNLKNDAFLNVISEDYKNEAIDIKKKKAELQLGRLFNLDQISTSKRRTEQYILREYLLGGNDSGSCAICSKEYPINFLATAHIKKRSKCTIEEKKDINIVMPTCHFGCDKLFEDGYVIVRDGIIQNNISNKKFTPSIEDYINNLENNKCNYYNENTQRYFKEHERSYV